MIKNRDKYAKIVNLLTQDEKILSNLNMCFDSPKSYFEKNEERYDSRGIDSDKDDDVIAWIAIANELIEGGIAIELDWKEELDEFLFQMKKLSDKENLEIQDELFDKDESIPTWCGILDAKWREQGFCVAAMDIDSDSYVMFVCTLDKLRKLAPLAISISHRFTFAKLM